jgi:glutamine amidotransferase
LIDGRTEYRVEFAASIRRPNLVATQFHPERSQAAGLRLLENFLRSSNVSGELTTNPLVD